MRWVVLLPSLLVGPAWAGSASGLFCPLAVEAGPGVTEPVPALQRRFAAVAGEASGDALVPLAEVERASAGLKDLATSNAALAKVAQASRVKHAGFVSMRVTERDEVLLEGRVVDDEGKLLKSSILSVKRAGRPLGEALDDATRRFFAQLNGTAPAPEPVAETTSGPAPIARAPAEPPNPGTPLRILGAVLGVGGVGACVTGGVLLGTAGTVQKDAYGNVAIADAPRVSEIRAKQSAAFAFLTAGAALTLTGALMFVLAPNAPVTASLAPTSDGATFAVGGTF